MRSHCDWFIHRAASIWKASPAKSFLILSPHGLPETQLASLLKSATEAEFVMPSQHANARPVVLNLSPDTTRSSRHFVKRVGTMMAKACSIDYTHSSDDDPSDALLDIVETALDQGVHLILVIERFHAFVDIVDDDLLSTLSTLRTLEHNRRVTTIAITPISYAQMRRQMSPTSAFVNSSYGDNHDRAVPEPVTREEFTAFAVARGILGPEAQRLFQIAGGPDLFAEKMIEAKRDGASDLVGATLALLGDHVQTFIEKSFPEVLAEDGKLLERLGLGTLSPLDHDLFQSNPLKAFIIKERTGGQGIIASTPLLSRWALKRGQSDWRAFEQALAAFRVEGAVAAWAYVAELKPSQPRLKCFTDTLQLLAVLDGGIDSAMLSVDWDLAGRLAKAVCVNNGTPSHIKAWADGVVADVAIVTSSFKKGEMTRLDKLTVRAHDPNVEKLLLGAITAFVEKTKRLSSPTTVVKALATIPEAILQSIAAARCSIDFTSVRELGSTTPFQNFFAGPGEFIVPYPGKKLDLTALLVIVPSLLAESETETILSDKAYIIKLQSKLVTQVRNVVAHTSATFEKKDALYLTEVTEQLLQAWQQTMNAATTQWSSWDNGPTHANLNNLLYGDYET
ncbi:hypothetical protein [Agrobacterium sp.]|uniref:hypothetical protein n=1 Tax=Agrobacterium sp. TaxID=361 RepID=UPI0025C1CAAF|nr:hypothetical protein [Agrobacterium sp.]MCD4660402.1 hypothetical protein [Agrobacterium sp.]